MPPEDFAEWERWFTSPSFSRIQTRKALLKRKCDCGHWVDGSEPYRYMVWRMNSDDRGVIHQRTDCEHCTYPDLRG